MTALLLMAFYADTNARWTSRFDSFAMMQLGAAIAEDLPLLLAPDKHGIKILDELPGWVGDCAEGKGLGKDKDKAGQLALGARTPLKGGRRYRSFDVGDEHLKQHGKG